MSKPIWQSWKNYAQELEIKLNKLALRERYLERYDKTIRQELAFPNIDVLIDYIKMKARINSEMSSHFTYISEETMPTCMNEDIFRLQCRLNPLLDDIREYAKNRGVFFKEEFKDE